MSLTDRQDSEWMRRAIDIATGGWGQTRPNPMVGAVLVADGEVVGEGFHSRYGEAHAEVEAIRQASDRARGSTLYVTLEPCGHDGKTPSCCRMILDAGIQRVVYANADPHPEAGGGAVELAGAGLELTGGVLAGEAARLNSAFLWWHRRRASFVALKLAVSLDGKIAEREGVHGSRRSVAASRTAQGRPGFRCACVARLEARGNGRRGSGPGAGQWRCGSGSSCGVARVRGRGSDD